MGKRRLDKLQAIKKPNHRKVTYCKRKKGLLKKAIELSILCDVNVFVLIHDEKKKRCIQFANSSKLDLVTMFNDEH